ncbi:PREDICTED: GRF1-interacting factor 2 isoform X2 [Nelumbo nucifera]|uniref:GRF1-interacting factor 2 isoform X2 n=1 Tax=Nelumbo nucifera TaxID=4432 RepID=A0A1U7ZDX6_NELNU|nr:PREDICTED: GRF1-interacting factor 2 isoform X2 [Nelumbo nucifera]
MQQPPSMLPMMPSFPPTNITTEQIQKYLDENKKLILAILDNQNLGKLAECAQYQALLQKNLMYLAAIADAQPQTPAMAPQMPPHHAMQHGAHYMQHPQAALASQPGVFAPKVPMQFNPQQMQDHQQQQHQLHQHQQAVQGHMAMRPGINNGMLAMQNESILGGGNGGGPPPSGGLAAEYARGSGGGGSASSGPLDVRGNKHDVLEAASGDGQGNSTPGRGSADGEPSYLKGSENAS